MSKAVFWQRVALILLVGGIVFVLIALRCAPQAAVGIATAIVLIARDVWASSGGNNGKQGGRDGAAPEGDA